VEFVRQLIEIPRGVLSDGFRAIKRGTPLLNEPPREEPIEDRMEHHVSVVMVTQVLLHAPVGIKVDGQKRAGPPVGRGLEDCGPAEASMGEQKVLAKPYSIGVNNRVNREAAQLAEFRAGYEGKVLSEERSDYDKRLTDAQLLTIQGAGWWSKLWKGVEKFFSGVVKAAKKILNYIVEPIKQFISAVKFAAASGKVGRIFGAIGSIIAGSVLSFFASPLFAPAIMNTALSVATAVAYGEYRSIASIVGIGAVTLGLSVALQGVGSFLAKTFEYAFKGVSLVVDKLASGIKAIGGVIYEGLQAVVTTVKEYTVAAYERVVSAARDFGSFTRNMVGGLVTRSVGYLVSQGVGRYISEEIGGSSNWLGKLGIGVMGGMGLMSINAFTNPNFMTKAYFDNSTLVMSDAIFDGFSQIAVNETYKSLENKLGEEWYGDLLRSSVSSVISLGVDIAKRATHQAIITFGKRSDSISKDDRQKLAEKAQDESQKVSEKNAKNPSRSNKNIEIDEDSKAILVRDEKTNDIESISILVDGEFKTMRFNDIENTLSNTVDLLYYPGFMLVGQKGVVPLLDVEYFKESLLFMLNAAGLYLPLSNPTSGITEWSIDAGKYLWDISEVGRAAMLEDLNELYDFYKFGFSTEMGKYLWDISEVGRETMLDVVKSYKNALTVLYGKSIIFGEGLGDEMIDMLNGYKKTFTVLYDKSELFRKEIVNEIIDFVGINSFDTKYGTDSRGIIGNVDIHLNYLSFKNKPLIAMLDSITLFEIGNIRWNMAVGDGGIKYEKLLLENPGIRGISVAGINDDGSKLNELTNLLEPSAYGTFTIAHSTGVNVLINSKITTDKVIVLNPQVEREKWEEWIDKMGLGRDDVMVVDVVGDLPYRLDYDISDTYTSGEISVGIFNLMSQTTETVGNNVYNDYSSNPNSKYIYVRIVGGFDNTKLEFLPWIRHNVTMDGALDETRKFIVEVNGVERRNVTLREIDEEFLRGELR